MRRYHIDEETMTQIENMVAEYDPNGENGFEAILIEMQSMSPSEWEKMPYEKKQEYIAAVSLYMFSGYMVEHGDEDSANIETYQGICGDFTACMYQTDSSVEGAMGAVTTYSLNKELVSMTIRTLGTIGGDDTLAMNAMGKIMSDTNKYQQYEDLAFISEFHVTYDYDESGFVEVSVQSADDKHNLLAIGHDMASAHYYSVTMSVDGESNHGLTSNQTIGMIMSVENLNDLQMMDNILMSDQEFNVNGNNAFDIDYNNGGANSHYSPYISDSFSVGLASMGTFMLYNNSQTSINSYQSYMNAVLSASLDEPGNHNLLLDISSSAGIYVDNCVLAVYADEEGGDNDAELEAMLNAANANYGAWADVYSSMPVEAAGSGQGPKPMEYESFDCQNISYDSTTGVLSLDINYTYLHPTVSGMSGGNPTYGSAESTETVHISSQVYTGSDAMSHKLESQQVELREEIERKKNELAADSVIELIAMGNPLVGDILNGVMGIGRSDISDAVNVSADSFEDVFSSEAVRNGAEGIGHLLGDILEYSNIQAEYDLENAKIEDLQKLLLCYSYNSGSNTIGLYDYNMIRLMQRWNKEGIQALDGYSGNDKVYQSIVTEGGDSLTYEATEYLAKTLLNIDPDENIVNAKGEVLESEKDIYAYLNDELGYSKDEILSAMTYMISGENCGQTAYSSVSDIPFELRYACVYTIKEIYDPSLFNAIENTYISMG